MPPDVNFFHDTREDLAQPSPEGRVIQGRNRTAVQQATRLFTRGADGAIAISGILLMRHVSFLVTSLTKPNAQKRRNVPLPREYAAYAFSKTITLAMNARVSRTCLRPHAAASDLKSSRR